MNDSVTNSRFRYLIVLCAFSAALVLPFLHLKPFYSKGEPREALVPQQMLRTGNWILPERYGERIATKPPMAHWLMAAASLPAGRVSEGSARLPSALLSIAALLAFYWTASGALGSRQAFLAGVLLLGSVEWHRASLTARVDMTLTAFLLLSLLQLYRWAENGAKKFPFLAILLLAAAFLTKGPVGVVLPLAAVSIYLWLQGASVLRIGWLCAKTGIPAALIASVWYVLAYRQGGSEFLSTVFSENVARFTGTMAEDGDPHAHSFLYLLGTVFLGMLPWTGLLLFMQRPQRFHLKGLWSRIRAAAHSSAADRFLLFSAVVIVEMLLFYAVPASKRSVYLLPIYPFLCVFVARGVNALQATRPRRVQAALAVLAAAVLVVSSAVIVLFLWAPDPALFISRPDKLREVEYFRGVVRELGANLPWYGTVLLWLPGVCALSALLLRGGRLYAPLALGSFFAILLTVNGVVLPGFAAAVSGKQFAEEARAKIHDGEMLVAYRVEAYGVDFYMGGAIRSEDLKDCPAGGCAVLLKKADLESLRHDAGTDAAVEVLTESQHGVGKFKDVMLLARVTGCLPFHPPAGPAVH